MDSINKKVSKVKKETICIKNNEPLITQHEPLITQNEPLITITQKSKSSKEKKVKEKEPLSTVGKEPLSTVGKEPLSTVGKEPLSTVGKEPLSTVGKEPLSTVGIETLGNTLLKKYFGYNALKDEQQKIINTIITDRKDVIAVLATGFGKSICYQLPVLIAKKSVIVICPLIALMNEQYDFLKDKGIPVCIFNGDTPKKDREVNEYELLKGNYKLIYMTPEYFVKS